MTADERHGRGVINLVTLLEAFFAARRQWTVLRHGRWRPLAAFPDRQYTFDAVLLPTDGCGVLNVASDCYGPDIKPVAVFDVIGRRNYDFDTFVDKGDDLARAGVREYCVWDPSGECLRPQLCAWRKKESALRKVRTSADGVFFSDFGFRLTVSGDEVDIRPSGDSRLEEELFTCERLLSQARTRANREQIAVGGLAEKADRLRAILSGGGA